MVGALQVKDSHEAHLISTSLALVLAVVVGACGETATGVEQEAADDTSAWNFIDGPRSGRAMIVSGG